MTLEELWALFPIVLTPHQPQWAAWAKDEMGSLSRLLQDYSPIVNHIGSTAIPEIWAKPIIDILIEIPRASDWQSVKVLLEHSGYICMSESETRMSFNKGYTPHGYDEKVFHVHVRWTGDNDELYFRDYLRANPAIAREYEALKRSFLPEYKHNRDGYTEAKSAFVEKVMKWAKPKPDVAVSNQRHANMAAIHGKDTKPEMVVRRYLWAHGFRYRLNHPRLPGKPDVVLRKYRTCIFVNGCFWHGHEDCRFYTIPKTNTEFWVNKIRRNKERDLKVQRELASMGWHSITIWECELKPATRENTLKSLAYTLNKIFLQDRTVREYEMPEEKTVLAAEDLPRR